MTRRTFFACCTLALTTCAAPSAPPSHPHPRSYTERIRGTDITFDMVWIPTGNFWIGRTEVTWDEYLAYCDFGERQSIPPGVDAVSRPSKPLETFPYDRDWGRGRRPAVGMSRDAARQYCNWLTLHTGHNYGLPTEAEWQLACGDAPSDLDAHAWHDGNSGGKTHEVGQKASNAHGVHDMLGNLWEYTRDPFDPAQPEWAALRGGSWSDAAATISPGARLQFDEFWTLPDPNVPPGVWWVPEGEHLGMRVLRSGPE